MLSLSKSKNYFLLLLCLIILWACSREDVNKSPKNVTSSESVFKAKNAEFTLDKNKIYGEWKINFTRAGPISINPLEGEKYEGKIVKITGSVFREPYFETKCKNPEYSFVLQKDVDKFLDNTYRIEPEEYDMDVPEIYDFEVVCGKDDASFLYLSKSKRIVMYFDGIFFYMDKM